MNSKSINKSMEYAQLDIIKFIGSIIVVMIHTNFIISYNYKFNWYINISVFTIAVPIFFLTTGFLINNKLKLIEKNKQKEYIVKYLNRIIKLYCIWSFIYFPISIFELIESNKSFTRIILEYIRNFVFVTSYQHLWYLLATIVGVGILYIWTRRFKLKSLIINSMIIYLIGSLMVSYNNIISKFNILNELNNYYIKIFVQFRNGLFFGLIFITIGALISELNIKTKSKKIFIIFLLSLIPYLLEIVIIDKFNLTINTNIDMRIFLLPTVVLLFIMILNINLKSNNFTRWCRKASTIIYTSHMLFLIVLKKILISMSLDYYYQDTFLFTITSILGIIGFVKVILYLSNKYKVFKHLY